MEEAAILDPAAFVRSPSVTKRLLNRVGACRAEDQVYERNDHGRGVGTSSAEASGLKCEDLDSCWKELASDSSHPIVRTPRRCSTPGVLSSDGYDSQGASGDGTAGGSG